MNQISDLRELIPEIFYFPPLFYNINEIHLKQLSNGEEIDNVIIKEWGENNLKKVLELLKKENIYKTMLINNMKQQTVFN